MKAPTASPTPIVLRKELEVPAFLVWRPGWQQWVESGEGLTLKLAILLLGLTSSRRNTVLVSTYRELGNLLVGARWKVDEGSAKPRIRRALRELQDRKLLSYQATRSGVEIDASDFPRLTTAFAATRIDAALWNRGWFRELDGKSLALLLRVFAVARSQRLFAAYPRAGPRLSRYISRDVIGDLDLTRGVLADAWGELESTRLVQIRHLRGFDWVMLTDPQLGSIPRWEHDPKPGRLTSDPPIRRRQASRRKPHEPFVPPMFRAGVDDESKWIQLASHVGPEEARRLLQIAGSVARALAGGRQDAELEHSRRVDR